MEWESTAAVHLPKEAAHMPVTAALRRVQIVLYGEVTGLPKRLAWALAEFCIRRLALGPQPPVVSKANGMNNHPALEHASEYLETLAHSALEASTEGEAPIAEA